ncbi:uncharacterized protein CBL_06834 [Carabus blaptoides fortunei]
MRDLRPKVRRGYCLQRANKMVGSEIKALDGSMHYTKFSMSAGGVARNICEALGKLGAQPHLLSAVGNDSHGRYLRANLPAASTRALVMVDSCPSAQCTVVLDSNGECKLLLGEMDIHKHITPAIIMSQAEQLKRCPLIVIDGNLGNEALACVLEIADKYGRPVFYEPTDIPVSAAPFSCPNYRAVKYISPNLNELRIIAQSLGVSVPPASSDTLAEAAHLGRLVAEYIDTVFVTLGARGLLVVRKGTAKDPLHGTTSITPGDVRVRHYNAAEITQIVNVSGAGDCLASGIIVAMLAGLPESVCVSVGFAAAQMALQSRSAVPSVLFDKNHVSWTQTAAYTEL